MSKSGYIEFNANNLSTGGTNVNNSAVAAIELTTPTVTGSTHIEPIPTGGCVWSHIEIFVLGQNGANYNCLLSWDAAGKMPIFSFNAITNGTGSPLNGMRLISSHTAINARLDISPTYPLGGDLAGEVGKVYLHMKSDNSGADKVQYARLHWRNAHKG